jgi:transcription initiation factor TFIIB
MMSNENFCPHCGSKKLLYDSENGELACADCGLVVHKNEYDFSPEWRAFTEEDRGQMERIGPPRSSLFDNGGLSTKIVPTKKTEGDSQDPNRYLRLAKWQDRSASSSSEVRSLPKAQWLISSSGLKLKCPRPVAERAAEIYREAHVKGLVKGRAMEAEAMAALYMSCKRFDNPRTLEEISRVSGVKKSSIAKSYREMVWSMGSPKNKDESTLVLARLSDKLNLRGRGLKLALELLEQAKEKKLSCGRSPTSLAAACVYLSSMMIESPITQKTVASVANVTEVTLRNRYKEMIEVLGLKVPV